MTAAPSGSIFVGAGGKEMGLAGWFSTFCANLQNKDGNTISYRYQRITGQLNTDFWTTTSDTEHSLYVGSYGRNTAIAGPSDVDMLFQLPYAVYQQYDGHAGNGQSALLQAVRNSMAKTYSTSHIGADGQVVQVNWDDGISFEVLPAFRNTDDSYTFPDTNGGGSWKTTNPKPEIAAMRTRNAACNDNLMRLCRMMRAWKQQWSVPISGLLIDTLAYQFIETYQYRDKSYLYYDFICRDFFAWMAGQDKEQEYWRAPGSGQRVYGKGLFQYKAKQCYNLAVEAINHDTAKQDWSAKQKWRKIFGTTFPN
ncbi:MAG: hypothetical protein OJF49_001069 [Ktedonobacterales bacterium]|jgi:hypothetical protein|nr:MAG: hypothetical protein OJF49_001069 [Ktedonobacterales bacterium]